MPDSTDQGLLLVVQAVLEASTQATAPWPGYDAAARPLLVYRVGRWSILLNPPSPDPAEDWVRYPASWPPLSSTAWLDLDGDPNLVGQLVFDYEVPGGRVVAVPLYEDLPSEYAPRDLHLFSFIVHEAFHQFQRYRFSDVNTPSEEQYPILDPVNNALAALELRALREALETASGPDGARSREAAVMAVAVHDGRLDRLDDVARAIERSKEIVEGTAKYVETRSIAAFAEHCRAGASPRLQRLCGLFEDIDAARWLADDFDRRMTSGAIAPTAMARNRIYPMAAAVAVLLDVYQPDWKSVIEREGTARGLFVHLSRALGTSTSSRSVLVSCASTSASQQANEPDGRRRRPELMGKEL